VVGRSREGISTSTTQVDVGTSSIKLRSVIVMGLEVLINCDVSHIVGQGAKVLRGEYSVVAIVNIDLCCILGVLGICWDVVKSRLEDDVVDSFSKSCMSTSRSGDSNSFVTRVYYDGRGQSCSTVQFSHVSFGIAACRSGRVREGQILGAFSILMSSNSCPSGISFDIGGY
jgi:hypothetical protein